MGLDSVELIMEIEHTFNIEFNSEELETEEAATVGGLFSILWIALENKKQFNQNEPYLAESDIYEDYLKLLTEKIGFDKDKITNDSHFINDLGLD